MTFGDPSGRPRSEPVPASRRPGTPGTGRTRGALIICTPRSMNDQNASRVVVGAIYDGAVVAESPGLRSEGRRLALRSR
jgi:hypothetical protein